MHRKFQDILAHLERSKFGNSGVIASGIHQTLLARYISRPKLPQQLRGASWERNGNPALPQSKTQFHPASSSVNSRFPFLALRAKNCLWKGKKTRRMWSTPVPGTCLVEQYDSFLIHLVGKMNSPLGRFFSRTPKGTKIASKGEPNFGSTVKNIGSFLPKSFVYLPGFRQFPAQRRITAWTST